MAGQHSPSRPSFHRERGAYGNDGAQAVRGLQGNDTHTTTSLSHEQLHALACLVAEPFERRGGGLSQTAAAVAGEAA